MPGIHKKKPICDGRIKHSGVLAKSTKNKLTSKGHALPNKVLKASLYDVSSQMLTNKKLIVTKSFSKPGNTLHVADADQFVTIKCVRASTDDGEMNIQEVADGDVFRLSVSDDMSVWISLKSVKDDGVLLSSLPLSQGETIRVSVSQNMIGKYLVFGYLEYPYPE